MCCFSQPVEIVSDTNIFARSANGRQFLVYGMSYAAVGKLAMVLPLPVPPNPPEDPVRFINLRRYPTFFDDMSRGFPPRMMYSEFRGAPAVSFDPPKLRVHDVGDFEASFVPRIDDFARLDERFRISRDVWDRLPTYHDYGFAVFKLKETTPRLFARFFGTGVPSGTGPIYMIRLAPSARWIHVSPTGSLRKPRRVHPMAFEFPRRNPELLYFPTVHVHDRDVDSHAMFDHMLYCQPDAGMDDYLHGWEESDQPPSRFMKIARAEGIVDPNRHCWRQPLQGRLDNQDTLIGRGGSIPAPAM